MRAVVVYKSMYGNTHLIADAIGAGLSTAFDVRVVPVSKARPEVIADANLVVVGGPTHVHGMSRASTRKAAVEAADKLVGGLKVEPDAMGPGLREWFGWLVVTRSGRLPSIPGCTAATLTGRAAKGVARRLRQHGFAVIAEPESFLVTKQDRLEPQEQAGLVTGERSWPRHQTSAESTAPDPWHSATSYAPRPKKTSASGPDPGWLFSTSPIMPARLTTSSPWPARASTPSSSASWPPVRD